MHSWIRININPFGGIPYSISAMKARRDNTNSVAKDPEVDMMLAGKTFSTEAQQA